MVKKNEKNQKVTKDFYGNEQPEIKVSEESTISETKPAEIVETKEQKFTRLATSRVNKIIEQFRKLGNLSNKSIYAFTEEQVSNIFNAISEQYQTSMNKFNGVKSVKKFSL